VKGKLGAALVCLLFAIPFGGVGAGATWAIVTMIKDGLSAKDWVLVKADVTGPQSYRYTFEGKTYASDRLGTLRLGGTSDVDDFDERVASILAKGRDEQKPITVWVNPDNPSEAMIDRAIRWSFLVFLLPFALAFGGVGLGALWMFVHSVRSPAEGKRNKARKVSAPAGSAGSGIGFIWFFAIVWNAIAFPIALLAVPQALANGEWLILFVLLFPLIGVLILWSAIASTLAYLRRGRARLKLATAAPRLGAPVEGHFEFAYGVKPGDAFNVRLVCERTFRGGDDTSITNHWTRQVSAKAVDSAAGVRVPFRVDAPSNQPATDEDDDKPVTHKWRVEIEPASRAMAFPYRQEIVMARASFDGLHAPAAEAPVHIDPVLEEMLGSKFDAKKLTDQQKQAFAQMTPEQQAKLAKFLRFMPTGGKLIITIVCLVIAIEVVPMIFALVR
jgi:hypothetical protein